MITLFCYIIYTQTNLEGRRKASCLLYFIYNPETQEPRTQNILDRLIFAKVYIKMKNDKIKVILLPKIKSNYLWEEGNQIK